LATSGDFNLAIDSIDGRERESSPGGAYGHYLWW